MPLRMTRMMPQPDEDAKTLAFGRPAGYINQAPNDDVAQRMAESLYRRCPCCASSARHRFSQHLSRPGARWRS